MCSSVAGCLPVLCGRSWNWWLHFVVKPSVLLRAKLSLFFKSRLVTAVSTACSLCSHDASIDVNSSQSFPLIASTCSATACWIIWSMSSPFNDCDEGAAWSGIALHPTQSARRLRKWPPVLSSGRRCRS